MAAKQRTAIERRALELARQLAEEVYGAEGPALDSSIDDIEEVAAQAIRAAFDGVEQAPHHRIGKGNAR